MSTGQHGTSSRVRHHTAALLGVLGTLVVTAVPTGAAEPVGWTTPMEPPLRVARGFEPPLARWLAGHRGVDLAAAPDATVRSAGAGLVTFVGLVAGRGVVVVRHVGGFGEVRTTYEPVAASVVAGQAVAAGAPIGRLTAAGGHCRPAWCLHWGLLRNGAYADPLTLLQVTAVRLLPLGAAVLTPTPPRWLRPSGPRMGLFIGPAQPFDGHVRVDLRRGQ